MNNPSAIEISKEKLNLENQIQDLLIERKEIDKQLWSIDEKIRWLKTMIEHLEKTPADYFNQLKVPKKNSN